MISRGYEKNDENPSKEIQNAIDFTINLKKYFELRIKLHRYSKITRADFYWNQIAASDEKTKLIERVINCARRHVWVTTILSALIIGSIFASLPYASTATSAIFYPIASFFASFGINPASVAVLSVLALTIAACLVVALVRAIRLDHGHHTRHRSSGFFDREIEKGNPIIHYCHIVKQDFMAAIDVLASKTAGGIDIKARLLSAEQVKDLEQVSALSRDLH